eukprot:CAMPEP_0119416760 /NCGR_PEP_ID=MMETSP1335-20130426/14011_1 /TAXON_ID=259385 /ORGANISM="Chrysoculter rhomboideus, Strain RCC1486" /LENGTH=93 /DNA_ID=CAMNT_0007441901 /DNA_START=252 /DNA_END=530 /DNA_ORIENTATION=-
MPALGSTGTERMPEIRPRRLPRRLPPYSVDSAIARAAALVIESSSDSTVESSDASASEESDLASSSDASGLPGLGSPRSLPRRRVRRRERRER